MGKFTEKFEKIKASEDSDEINDFLIQLGNNPKKKYMPIIDYYIEKHDPVIFSQIKLNLIYLIGQIGVQESLANKYPDFLIEEYYSSDRWIRNEILTAINKMAHNIKLSEKFFDILKYALIDDYLPISMNAMKTILLYENIPVDFFKRIFRVLQDPDAELQDHISNVLMKFIKNENHLFELLNTSENYHMFTKKASRLLLLIFFNSAMSLGSLESFRELIERSGWDKEYKEMFLNEINTYQKLLLKNI